MGSGQGEEGLMNLKFQNAISGIPNATPPVWMMRQAGRYHKHYQNLRKSHSFVDLCKVPELAAETALGPIMDFDFDVAILFSDLLFPLEALGMDLSYESGGPKLGQSLDAGILSQFRSLDKAMPHLAFQKEAVAATRKVLPKDKSLIGFVGGPWTLFVYAVEGTHKGNIIEAKKRAPQLFKPFCEVMVPLLQKNIQLQLDGGAEAVMILDTAAGDLAPQEFSAWSADALLQMLKPFPNKVGYYAKGSTSAVFDLLSKKSGGVKTSFGIGVDHRFDLSEILKQKKFPFVQGNFDQILLHLPPNEFEMHLRRYLEPLAGLSREERAGWVCGVGHGLVPTTSEANVKRFVQIVREVFA